MEKRERGTGSRRQKGRRREPEKGPSLSAWLRCYAQDEQNGRGGSETRSERTGEHTEGQSIGEKHSENVSDWSGRKNGVGWSEAC